MGAHRMALWVAGGTAVAWLAGITWRGSGHWRRAPSIDRVPAARWDLAAVVLVALLLGLTGTFAAAVIPREVKPFKKEGASAASLNATAYVLADQPDEGAAIALLDDRDGTPTVVAVPSTCPHQ